MNKYNDLKNFIDNFIDNLEKNISTLKKSNPVNQNSDSILEIELDNDETEKFNKSADAVRSMNDALDKIL